MKFEIKYNIIFWVILINIKKSLLLKLNNIEIWFYIQVLIIK